MEHIINVSFFIKIGGVNMKLISRNDLFDNTLNLIYSSFFNNIMRTDIYEKDGNFIIEMDLPGFKKEEININLEDKYLIISVSKKEEKEEVNTYIRKERYYGEYKRSFYVGTIKEDSIKASYTDGILRLSYPKVQLENNTKRQIIID